MKLIPPIIATAGQLALCFLLGFLPEIVIAQDNAQDSSEHRPLNLSQLPLNNPALRDYFSKVYQQPVDSPVMKLIFEAMKSDLPSQPTPPPQTAPEGPHAIFRHLRSAKGGIPLPTREEIQKKSEELAQADQKFYDELQGQPEFQEALDKEREKQDALAKVKHTPPKLASCDFDITKIIRLEDGGEDKVVRNENVLGDILFTRGPVPMDPDLAFGIGTNVVQYTSDENNYVAWVASSQGMNCLPYRIRFTSEHIIHDLGMNALKNYDNNPKGELYEGIKQRLSEYR